MFVHGSVSQLDKCKEGPRRTKKDAVRLSKLRQTSQAAFAASSFSSWLMQVLIVSGGNSGYSRGRRPEAMSSTETLAVNGGITWKLVASLPSGRWGARGLGLDNGRFLVTGQLTTCTYCDIYRMTDDAWQVEGERGRRGCKTSSSMTRMRTSGPRWEISAVAGVFTPCLLCQLWLRMNALWILIAELNKVDFTLG